MSIKISQLNEISASNMSGSNYFPIVSDYEAPAFTASTYRVLVHQFQSFISTGSFTGSFYGLSSGSFVGSLTGSVRGIADSSSYSTFAVTASYLSPNNLSTSSYSVSGGFAYSSSYADSAASLLYPNASTASFSITSSYVQTSSYSVTSSFAQTSSYVNQAVYSITSSFSQVSNQSYSSTSASYSLTSSLSLSSSYALTSSRAITSSYSIRSFLADTSSISIVANTAITSSYALQALNSVNAVTASYVITASYLDVFTPKRKVIFSTPGTHSFQIKKNDLSVLSGSGPFTMRATAIGAGGGGAGATSTGINDGGTGGGGGAAAQGTSSFFQSTIFTIVVGSGGAPGTGSINGSGTYGSSGQNGTDSYCYDIADDFYLAYADGGYGGQGGVLNPNSGSGGLASLCSGSIFIYPGADGEKSTTLSGSAGGCCFYGAMGGIQNPAISTSPSSSWNGYEGDYPGGGGGGASSFLSVGVINGGSGSHGQVILEW
jgi:hypothetical protein